jgi:hypothetical protein
MTDLVKKTYDRIRGVRKTFDGQVAVHTHLCDEGHTWLCNSPYCEDLTGPCPEHGGLEPIVQGREPWRGR